MADQRDRPSRPRLLGTRALVVLGLLGAIFVVWLLIRPTPFPDRLKFGSGVPDGTWDTLGDGLMALLEERQDGLTVEKRHSNGSRDNVNLLESGEFDIAFVQSDTTVGESVRLIAPLYENVLHLVVRGDIDPPVLELADLAKLRVSVGAIDSGTLDAANAVLDHTHFESDPPTRRMLNTTESQKAFEAGEVDAVFHFSALPGGAVKDLLAVRKSHVISLGDCSEGSAVDALRLAYPRFQRAVIPACTYGKEYLLPLGTVSVKAVLACRAGLEERHVRRITEIIFGGKADLAERVPAVWGMSETFDAAEIPFPLHPGADDYYHRKDPPFYVRYADPLSLVFAIMLAILSGMLTVRQWVRRSKKNRIDKFYLEIESISARIRRASRDELGGLLDELERVQRRAFQDLVRERVRADHSFTIFQDLLHGEVAAIHGRLRELPI